MEALQQSMAQMAQAIQQLAQQQAVHQAQQQGQPQAAIHNHEQLVDIPLRPTPYTPSQDWRLWRGRFEIYAQAQDLQPEQQRRMLVGRLGDAALATIVSRDPTLNIPYAEMMDILEARFAEPQGSHQSRIKFNAIKQESQENLDDYITRLRLAANNAYPGAAPAAHLAAEPAPQPAVPEVMAITPEVREHIILDKFISGIINLKIKEHLLTRTYANSQEALVDARRLELAQKECRPNHQLLLVKTSKCFHCGKLGHHQAECRQFAQQQRQSYMAQQKTNSHLVTCFYCGRQGHRQADCRKLVSDQKQKQRISGNAWGTGKNPVSGPTNHNWGLNSYKASNNTGVNNHDAHYQMGHHAGLPQ